MTSLNVLTNANGHPSGLNGPRKPVGVRRVLDFWRDGGGWWWGEPPRDYYLLELETGHVVEVFRAADAWTLSRTQD